MTDDANAPTIPETEARPSSGSLVKPPDRYVMRTLLGRGGMGEVWLARDVRIERDIAIKLMRRDRSQGDEAVARFLREARVQGRLEHPGIVPVHDLGEQDAPYFAMKRLAGTNLADVVAAHDEAKWPRRTLLARFIDVCLAVEFAHERGVIHRDLKPANIMLGDYGESYVLDWGLARVSDAPDSDVIRTSDLVSGDDTTHTVAGQMLGTPGYMSPEQMRGEPVDRRTDVYALGCILHEIVAGVPAVPRDRALELTLTAPCHRPSAHEPQVDVPPELDDACARATAADPERRLPTARALADAVQQFLDGDRDLARRKELAQEHALRAASITGDDASFRAEAMREAGRAIALDPGNSIAQGVLARLLLTPPREIPAAAREKLERERADVLRRVYRGGAITYLLLLLLIPVIIHLGIAASWPVGVITLELLALGLTCVYAYTRARVTNLALLVLFEHFALLTTVGFVLGPLLLTPILMFGTLPIGLMLPILRRPMLVAGAHLMSFVLPMACELAGVVPHTFTLTGGLTLTPWAAATTPTALAFLIAVIVFTQVIANTYILDAQRGAQDRAQEQLHVQAWQLAQLVPQK
jgi:serine/threonine-protein kinase